MKLPTDLCANPRCRHPRSSHGIRYRSVRLATCGICAQRPYEGEDGDMRVACYRFREVPP